MFRSNRVQAIAFLLRCFAIDHACCLLHSAKQIGLRGVSFLFPRGSESPFVRSHMLVWLSGFAGSLLACAFPLAIPTELRTGLAIRKGTPLLCDVPFAMDL